ncbi:hypothetical protein CR162_01805 [Pseudoroseomonas rhizosphaerae]|uniref:Uncharacterized protein n=1 Tax=Teichococcus rhizosphaerae TaxID=1335062 RepID=A0A2C7AHQ6_9PROT|nr:hypothetical protein [Pseudoroseomonas rhizosphaerae]PHK96674.1 hypothetical protein CR162_01805 [Pseudoroseomonas rhizosphaerae]
MSAPQRLRPEPAAQADSATPTAISASGLPEGFRPTGAEDRLPSLLSYALAVDAGTDPTPEAAPARRAEAERLLHDWAYRRLHNQLERIRAEAAREALAGQRQPAGFMTVLAAVLAGLALFALLAWLAQAFGLSLPLPRG